MLSAHGIDIERIAIIDDSQSARDSLAEVVEDADLVPIPREESFDDLASCLEFVRKSSHAALVDHRLSPGNYASFSGAEVVSLLNKSKFPSLLITAFSTGDVDIIKPHLRFIPRIIPKGEAVPDLIQAGLKECICENNNEFSIERAPTRTLIYIDDVARDTEPSRVFAFISSWDPTEGVAFLINVIPNKLHSYVQPGARFFADVNTGASRQEQLFYTNFTVAEEPSGEYAKLLRS